MSYLATRVQRRISSSVTNDLYKLRFRQTRTPEPTGNSDSEPKDDKHIPRKRHEDHPEVHLDFIGHRSQDQGHQADQEGEQREPSNGRAPYHRLLVVLVGCPFKEPETAIRPLFQPLLEILCLGPHVSLLLALLLALHVSLLPYMLAILPLSLFPTMFLLIHMFDQQLPLNHIARIVVKVLPVQDGPRHPEHVVRVRADRCQSSVLSHGESQFNQGVKR